MMSDNTPNLYMNLEHSSSKVRANLLKRGQKATTKPVKMGSAFSFTEFLLEATHYNHLFSENTIYFKNLIEIPKSNGNYVR